MGKRLRLEELLTLAYAELYDAGEGKVVPAPRVASALGYIREALDIASGIHFIAMKADMMGIPAEPQSEERK